VGVSNSDLILLRNRVEHLENSLGGLKKAFNDFKKSVDERFSILGGRGSG